MEKERFGTMNAYFFLLLPRWKHHVCINHWCWYFRINFWRFWFFPHSSFVCLWTSPPSPSKKSRHRRLIRRWGVHHNTTIPVQENSLKCKRDPRRAILGTVNLLFFVHVTRGESTAPIWFALFYGGTMKSATYHHTVIKWSFSITSSLATAFSPPRQCLFGHVLLSITWLWQIF